MKVASYVRVSTSDQSPALQRLAIQRFVRARRGWRLNGRYEDLGISGVLAQRPARDRLLLDAHKGTFGALVVWKIDRLGRSVSDLVTVLDTLRALDIDFVSVTEGIDTSTVAGRMVYQMLAAIAEFEREIIRERVRAGVAAARRRRGGRWGPARRLLARELLERARVMRRAGIALRSIARTLRVPRTTLRRALRPSRVEARGDSR